MAKKDVTTGTCNSLLKLSSNAIQQIEHLSKKFPLNIKEKQELQPKTERSTVTFDTGWYQDAEVIMWECQPSVFVVCLCYTVG